MFNFSKLSSLAIALTLVGGVGLGGSPGCETCPPGRSS